MNVSARGQAPAGRVAGDFHRLRCIGEALQAVSDHVGPVADADDARAVEEALETAYSVIQASRTQFSPQDFALFFLTHLAQFAPSRRARQAARAGGLRYLLENIAALSPDLAALEGEARTALETRAVPAGRRQQSGEAAGAAPIRLAYAGDGQSVSEAFLDAYGTLRKAALPVRGEGRRPKTAPAEEHSGAGGPDPDPAPSEPSVPGAGAGLRPRPPAPVETAGPAAMEPTHAVAPSDPTERTRPAPAAERRSILLGLGGILAALAVGAAILRLI